MNNKNSEVTDVVEQPYLPIEGRLCPYIDRTCRSNCVAYEKYGNGYDRCIRFEVDYLEIISDEFEGE